MATLVGELVGRDAELARMEKFLDPALDTLSVLVLEGEAGIGKTTLWKAGVSAAVQNGYRVVSAAPTEAEAGLPFAVLGDLLDPIPDEAVASLSDPLRMALQVALFWAPAKQGPADQLAVSTALLGVLRHLAADRPVLLAVDDIQWADGPSARALSFATHRLDRDRVNVLAAMRLPSDSEGGWTIRNAVDHSRIERLEIGPLSRNAIDDLLLERLERPLRRPELDKIYTVSGGNPFYALEIGHFIVEHPTSVRAGEPIPVPQSLADAIEGRIEKLPRETRDILVALATLSRPDELLLQRADPNATAALNAAFNGRVVERVEGRLRFTHPLLASVIYSRADPAKRRAWHARLAEVVSDAEERARHLALSAIGPDAAVASALEEAARSANVRGAPDSAAALAQQAVALTPAELPRAIERRQIITAEYRMRAGDVPGARGLLESVLRSSPAGMRSAEALRLMGSLTLGGEDLAEAERFLIEALSQAREDERLQAIIERDLIRVLMQRGKMPEGLHHSARLTGIAARHNDPSLLALAQRVDASTHRHGGFSPEARATAVTLAEHRISVPMDDNAGGLHPLMDWAVVLKWSDDFVHARSLFKEILALTEGRDESLRAPVLFHLAEMECWAGDWLLAAVYAHECEKSVIHVGHGSYARLPLSAKGMLQCGRGEFEAARASARQALAISTTIGDDAFHRRALAILGATELAAGDVAAANQHFDTLRSLGNLEGYSGMIRSESDELDALIAVGRLGDADALGARSALCHAPWPRMIGARSRALLAAARGDLGGSIREFDRALTAHEALPMPLERARTLMGYARVLRRAKRKRAAREKLEEALVTFQALGGSAWIKRAQTELSRVAPAAAGVDALTPTEARVAALVASGRTNKEVAAELFLSVKTVEANLSRVYSKLHLRSRSELVVRMTSPR